MPIEILMPALSPTMREGRLARWLKAEGDAVKSGDALAEIETDKATMELESIEDGILGRILVPAETDGVAVNTPLALLLLDGESLPEAGATAAPPPPLPPPPHLPRLHRRHPRLRLPRPSAPRPRSLPIARPSATPCATRWPRKCAATPMSS
ncbi:pyruvate dehydrogenase subunit beta [Magnetospirillum fulvum MGU-K5]|uniref:Pyruvate dehydrogenase subunit beta n=1 Tax=Magnetospirillum fulvum MGU-K5 TaxID=1316936 RepID=S9TUZ4_MAGFU|nr:pyruvate dehydrogenase subunit beta [Magnetospirillum fulvum MGU-K5]